MKTLEELKKEGWSFIDNFAHCWIMGKGNVRIFWNPKTEEVDFSYVDEYKDYVKNVNESLGLY